MCVCTPNKRTPVCDDCPEDAKAQWKSARLRYAHGAYERATFKSYLGDGVYIWHDGFAVVLTAENGREVTHRIVLEEETLDSMLRWVENVRRAAKEFNAASKDAASSVTRDLTGQK